MASRFAGVGKAALAAAVALVLLGAPAEAVPVIDFDDILASGGTVTYSPVAGLLVGTDILFDTILATGTPLNSGLAIPCVGCSLDFTSGANTDSGPPTLAWGAGGSFVLTGTVPAAGIVADTILSGTFTSAGATAVDIGPGSNDIITITGIGVDNKHPLLLAHFGLPPTTDFTFAFSSLDVTGSVAADGTFVQTVDNADIVNTAVPEPATGVLLLLGLGSLAAYRGRRS